MRESLAGRLLDSALSLWVFGVGAVFVLLQMLHVLVPDEMSLRAEELQRAGCYVYIVGVLFCLIQAALKAVRWTTRKDDC